MTKEQLEKHLPPQGYPLRMDVVLVRNKGLFMFGEDDGHIWLYYSRSAINAWHRLRMATVRDVTTFATCKEAEAQP